MFYSEFQASKFYQSLYARLHKVLGSDGADEVLYSMFGGLDANDRSDYLSYLTRKGEDFDLFAAFPWDQTPEGFDYWHLVAKILENN